MQPFDFLARLEPITASLFNLHLNASIEAANQERVFQHQQQHYSYILKHKSTIKEIGKDELEHCTFKLSEADNELHLANIAAGAVAGAILQIAHQTISLAWETETERMKKGRMIGSQYLSRVIWHARNQAMHFEEGIPKNKKTRNSIMSLSKDFNIFVDDLDQNPRYLSFEILNILEWYNYETYAKDMLQMLNT